VPVDSDPDPDPDSPDDADATPTDSETRDAQESPREGDAPEASVPPETRDASTGTGTNSPDSRHRQIAEDARYRQVVDTAYQATARDAWARAVPESRAAWEDHKKRYPEESRAAPLTQPDGSWVAGGGRRLSPEQNAEVSKCCADLRDEADKVILPAMRRVEAADPERHLAGLENMLKGEDRLKEKIADYMRAPGVTARRAVDRVADAVRFTLTYDNPGRYADGVLADVELLKSEGFELIKLKNLWDADHYKGVNSQWRRPNTGLRFEMQFHTTESLEAKELTHEAYERIRGKTISATEERELEEFRRRANALLAAPPGIDRIKDFQE
jgi:hypothetical protein